MTALNSHFLFFSRESIVSTASPILSPFLSKHGTSSFTFFLLLPLFERTPVTTVVFPSFSTFALANLYFTPLALISPSFPPIIPPIIFPVVLIAAPATVPAAFIVPPAILPAAPITPHEERIRTEVTIIIIFFIFLILSFFQNILP